MDKTDELKGAIEAILFTMGDSVELEKIASAIEQDEDFTKELIYKMMNEYKNSNRGIQIIELNNSFQMCTKKEMYNYLIRIAKQPKPNTLSVVQLETLSIVAYKQPISRLGIEKIRGVKSDYAVNKLVEYGLIEECGRLDIPGHPIVFGTTEEFLRRFGIHNLDELPGFAPEQMAVFKEEAEEEAKITLNI